MITLILGIIAGIAAPRAEPHISRALAAVFLAEAPMTAIELRMFSFTVCLVAAAILAAVFDQGSAIGLALGAALGVFAPRLIERYKSR